MLGEHRGIPLYTIGQHKGLGISTREPLYVTDIDPEANAITVGSKEKLYQDELTASGLNWIAVEELKQPTKAKARIRYLHNEAEAILPLYLRGSCRLPAYQLVYVHTKSISHFNSYLEFGLTNSVFSATPVIY